PAGDGWTRLATVASVLAVAGIAATVSYRHMRGVALEHGEDPIAAAIIPISVDGLIVAASLTLLADSRAGRRRTWLPYTLLVLGSAASLAANVMHAEPTLAARVIAAWPPLALIGAYELLMRQIRATTRPSHADSNAPRRGHRRGPTPGDAGSARPAPVATDGAAGADVCPVASSASPGQAGVEAMTGPARGAPAGSLTSAADPTAVHRPDVAAAPARQACLAGTGAGGPGVEPSLDVGAVGLPRLARSPGSDAESVSGREPAVGCAAWSTPPAAVPGQRIEPDPVGGRERPAALRPTDLAQPRAAHGQPGTSTDLPGVDARRRAAGPSVQTGPARAVSKRSRLAALVAAVDPEDPRSNYALARDLAPTVGLHEGTARRYVAKLRQTTPA
ncbi:DUF2637 domain-containing protein, partial [Frankia nepalensis]|uniref:DUF2637 domain-containing protein n=1 Tax=Frankia nepalensis TaxID=1836974 RepID=UPI001EE4901C